MNNSNNPIVNFRNRLFNIESEQDFEELCLEVFNYQYNHVSIYHNYVNALDIAPSQVTSIEKIPFLPIEFFKSHQVLDDDESIEAIFTSSGTTGSTRSKHHVSDLSLYEESVRNCFNSFFGELKDYSILALLPSYIENGDSSLVYMIQKLMDWSGKKENGFFLYNHEELIMRLKKNEQNKQKTLLFGVTFALLDLAEEYQLNLTHTELIETGGMKGRKKELIRDEVHAKLKSAFGLKDVCSEYGMTELLSQSWSKGKGLYVSPPWMKVLIREVADPLAYLSDGKIGGINVIDLANLHSCSFISTSDLGKRNSNDTFEVLGRFDNSDQRGCSLMIS